MAEYTKIETAMEIICDLCKDLYPDEDCPGKCDWMEYLEENAADVAPVVHGRWLHSGYEEYSGHLALVKCSRCSHEAYAIACYVREGNYCPYCGARMDGGAGDEP